MLEKEVADMRNKLETQDMELNPQNPLSPHMQVGRHKRASMAWQAAGEKVGSAREFFPRNNGRHAKPEMDISSLLITAKRRFEELDANGNGFLEASELTQLTDWCMKAFKPREKYGEGRRIKKRDRHKATEELMKIADRNDDGKIDFDEFAEWFVSEVNVIKRRKKEDLRKGQMSPSVKPPIVARQNDSLDGTDDSDETRSSDSDDFPSHNDISAVCKSLDPYPSRKNMTTPSDFRRGQEPEIPIPAESPKSPYDLYNSRRYAGESSKQHPPKENIRNLSPIQIGNGGERMSNKKSTGTIYGERSRRNNNYGVLSASVPKTDKKPVAKPQTTPLRKSEPKRADRSTNRGEVNAPWRNLSDNGKLARSRVALFLKLNGNNKSNQLDESTIRSILTKCGVSKRQMSSMVDTFCEYCGSNNRFISFAQFNDSLPVQANEKTIWEIVQELSTVE